MNIEELTEYIESNISNEWWFKAASDSIKRGHWVAITERDNDDLYLARFWLSNPELSTVPDREHEYESGQSMMLHYFIRPDTDKALHDHPWDFSTTILTGSYQEHLPTDEWLKEFNILGNQEFILGPPWGDNIVTRTAGQTIHHKSTDLHCIGSIQEHTWSMVTTRERIARWGFHPEGEVWTESKEYLRSKQTT